MAKVLSKRYKNLDELAKANEEDLLKIPDVGPVAAKSIVDFFMNDKNKAEIELLTAAFNSCGNFLKFCCCENKNSIWWWLFNCF